MRRASLSGAWSGAYRYPGDAGPETVFEAVIEEVDGAFSGSTMEPNLLRPWLNEGVVTASIEGERRGSNVSFVKFMDGSGGMHHSIRYEGVVNGALTRIEGTWSIRNDWSGTFFMERANIANEEAVEREAEATQ